MANFNDIDKANKTLKTTDIKGKPYTEVHQRVKAFRMVYPEGFIKTEIVSLENGVCVIKATVGFRIYDECRLVENVLATGYAYENETSSFINKTSYIENCETSAVGRALGLAGFGIDTSIASSEEVQNAIANQEPKEDKAKTEKEDKAKTEKAGEEKKPLGNDRPATEMQKERIRKIVKDMGKEVDEEWVKNCTMAKASEFIKEYSKKEK